MSWSSEYSGTKEAVVEALAQNTQIPVGVRALIQAQVEQLKLDRWAGDTLTYQVFVKTNGHVDQSAMNVVIEVRPIANGVKPVAPAVPNPA